MQGGGLGGEQPAAARREAGVLAGQPAQAGAVPLPPVSLLDAGTWHQPLAVSLSRDQTLAVYASEHHSPVSLRALKVEQKACRSVVPVNSAWQVLSG